jgi:hypothetical protein
MLDNGLMEIVQPGKVSPLSDFATIVEELVILNVEPCDVTPVLGGSLEELMAMEIPDRDDMSGGKC